MDFQQTTVRMTMRMTRQQSYASVNAIANPADKAGSIKLSVEAIHPEGFDPAGKGLIIPSEDPTEPSPLCLFPPPML
jgi:hypothetical protein